MVMELLRRMVLTAVNYPHWREMPSTPESGERALNTKEKEYGTVGAVIFHIKAQYVCTVTLQSF